MGNGISVLSHIQFLLNFKVGTVCRFNPRKFELAIRYRIGFHCSINQLQLRLQTRVLAGPDCANAETGIRETAN
jgi:hypothetical protein